MQYLLFRGQDVEDAGPGRVVALHLLQRLTQARLAGLLQLPHGRHNGVRRHQLLGEVIKSPQRLHALLVDPEGADGVGCLGNGRMGSGR